jgi:hypothetical protein
MNIMTTEDLLAIAWLIFSLFLPALVSILIRRGKLKPAMFPPVLGVGAALLAFAVLMSQSLISTQKSALLGVTRDNLLWALAFGAIGYFSGRIFERRARNRK